MYGGKPKDALRELKVLKIFLDSKTILRYGLTVNKNLWILIGNDK